MDVINGNLTLARVSKYVGVDDRHLVNPKFFVAAHCVVVWVTVLWGTTTCIPCTHGRTFCSLSLKWNLIAEPCFVVTVVPPPLRKENSDLVPSHKTKAVTHIPRQQQEPTQK